jgi:hypothetical protein
VTVSFSRRTLLHGVSKLVVRNTRLFKDLGLVTFYEGSSDRPQKLKSSCPLLHRSVGHICKRQWKKIGKEIGSSQHKLVSRLKRMGKVDNFCSCGEIRTIQRYLEFPDRQKLSGGPLLEKQCVWLGTSCLPGGRYGLFQ